MDTVTIPKDEYEKLKREVKTLRSSKLYKQLLEFQESVVQHGEFTRKDLGF